MNLYSKLIEYPTSITELINYQNKIYLNTFNIRQIRNFQRFILKSRLIKQLIIYHILEINYSRNRISNKKNKKKTFLYFQFIREFQLSLNLSLLIKNSYQVYLRNQIANILWVLIYLPIHERLTNHSYLQNRLTKQNQYFIATLFESCDRNMVNSIQLIKFPFSFLLSSRLKYWLMKYILIESKYLIYWFYNRQLEKEKYSRDQIYLIRQSTLSLVNFIKAFYYCCFFFFLNYNELSPNINYWIQFDSLILLNQQLKYKVILKNTNIYSYNLQQGLILFGWFIKKKNSFIIRGISIGNIRSHQYEIVTFLQNAGTYPMDKVIILLNYKIRIWKTYYLTKVPSLILINRMNRYLFYRIWYFLKKRHKTRGIRWIIYHYFKKHQSDQKNWIFSINQFKLVTYDI
uniref:Uncharacterized protein n=1 Tax=Derbesia sp. WEST4838 TaxID=1847751 RepID=A0A1C9JBJ6_9CHLO|nr:hypothetical protein [Derbesia sp. WEST4838]AOP19211.1 hypothetical protein [Derbesia sp. WEST4838]